MLQKENGRNTIEFIKINASWNYQVLDAIKEVFGQLQFLIRPIDFGCLLEFYLRYGSICQKC